MNKHFPVLCIACLGLVFSCQAQTADQNPVAPLITLLIQSLPPNGKALALVDLLAFKTMLLDLTLQDPATIMLVDKKHALPADYVPNDLLKLDSRQTLILNKAGMQLRLPAIEALETMVRAAKKSNITLDISSAYRDWYYQKNLFQRYVNQHGLAEASRFSAKEGTSQHQLGTAIDFGSVDARFATTKASAWLLKNAENYGFSLSYPQGYENLTGYMYESWHYRWVGIAGAQFIRKYFDGIQQNALVWLHDNQQLIQTFLAQKE